ncbi:MAG: carbohydrate-binding family 9-like protein [Pirellulales bacterium]|nr:carbohydrate-binding family 9-like protein [Pirellulales bacterium]
MSEGFLVLAIFSLYLGGCVGVAGDPQGLLTYRVRRGTPGAIDADWDKGPWKQAPSLEIRQYMGERPEHRPGAQAKVLYDDENIYVTFRVEDRYVRAVAQENQDSVCADSCVEFFFTPGIDPNLGYFNLETNCGGTALFHYGKNPGSERTLISNADIGRIEIAHSLPKVVEPEIIEPTTWTLQYRLPFKVLERYCPIVRPAAGVVWRANFYKCADQTSHPHWLTWSHVDNPQPNFHLPQFFGKIVFD